MSKNKTQQKDGENDEQCCRLNFRSTGNYIINGVAVELGGGGHKFAAGARINKLSTLDLERDITRQLADKIEGEF